VDIKEENVDAALLCAYAMAHQSPDPSTQNGAVLMDDDGRILVGAFNEFPNGVLYTDERWERPTKYFYIEHAERNVIFDAAASGIATRGLTMVCPWSACADCARAIVQAGIKTLVRHRLANDESTTNERWNQTIVAGDEILTEGGVEIVHVDSLPGYFLRRDGVATDTGEL
jgi:dCMP deaminase